MATKDKAKKKSKLRHAEYYDFQGIQDKLYADSQKGRVFKHLVEIITLPENIRLAYPQHQGKPREQDRWHGRKDNQGFRESP